MPLADIFSRNYEILMTNRFGAPNAAYDSYAKTNDYPFKTFYHPHMSSETNFTISFWFVSTYIKFVPTSGPSTNMWIQTALRVQIARIAEEPRNGGHIQIFTAGAIKPILETSLLEFSNTQWKCAQLVRDGSALRLYIDRALVGEGQTTAAFREIPYAPLSFSGAVDDIRLYNRALDDAELSALLQSED